MLTCRVGGGPRAVGELTLVEALRARTLSLDCPPALVRAFPRWLQPEQARRRPTPLTFDVASLPGPGAR